MFQQFRSNFQRAGKEIRNYAILLIILGALMLLWPGHFINVLFRVIGIVLIASGIINLVRGIRSEDPFLTGSMMVPAGFAITFGVLFAIAPGFVTVMLVFLVGILTIYYGVRGLYASSVLGMFHTAAGVGCFIASLAAMFCGMMIMIFPWASAGIMIRVAGALLVLVGIWTIVTYIQGRKKGYGDDIIDVDYEEEDR